MIAVILGVVVVVGVVVIAVFVVPETFWPPGLTSPIRSILTPHANPLPGERTPSPIRPTVPASDPGTKVKAPMRTKKKKKDADGASQPLGGLRPKQGRQRRDLLVFRRAEAMEHPFHPPHQPGPSSMPSPMPSPPEFGTHHLLQYQGTMPTLSTDPGTRPKGTRRRVTPSSDARSLRFPFLDPDSY